MTEKNDHRADQGSITFIVTSGRFDSWFGRKAHWLIRKTWIRYTRFTGQSLARVLTIPFMVTAVIATCVSFNVPYHPDWPWVIFQVVFITWIIAVVHKQSHRTEGLNAMPPSFNAVHASLIFQRSRVFTLGFFIGITVMSIASLDLLSLFVGLQAFFYGLALYACAVGRPWPPAKKQRVPMRQRIPQILPRLIPQAA